MGVTNEPHAARARHELMLTEYSQPHHAAAQLFDAIAAAIITSPAWI